MFGPLAFALTFAQPALAADEVEPATVTLVGDADAAGKKKATKSEPAKAAPARGAAPAPSTQRSAPAPRSPASQARPSTSRPVNTESSHAPASTARPSSGDHPANLRGSASPSSADRHAPAESHESASHAAADRHAPAGHASADRHLPANTGHHAPAVTRAVARHRAATRGYASHHAAWVSHRTPYHWYGAWRPGHPHYWYHGVFVYGPPVVYVDGGGRGSAGGGGGGRSAEPKRSVNREGKFSLGVSGGSYLSGFHDGTGYGDAGLGLNVAYRPIEALAFQLSWTYHDASWTEGSARVQQPLQLSAQLFAFPWSRVSPYVLAGVTTTDRNLDQPFPAGPDLETDQPLWGPHAGVGIEFAIGKSVALDFDARFIGYVNKPVEDPSDAGAIQANMGLNFYF